MGTLSLAMAVIGATLVWPINRWAMRSDLRPESYGFWGCLAGTLVTGWASIVLERPLFVPKAWMIGGVIGPAYAIGYWLIIMYCLKIGPIGPTMAINNMGMIWPVLLGGLWLNPHPFNNRMILGVLLVSISLFIIGFGSIFLSPSRGQRTHGMSLRWFLWVFLGWILAGVSLTGQLAASRYIADNPVAVVFSFTSIAALILAPRGLGCGAAWKCRAGMAPGALAGISSSIAGLATQSALKHFQPGVAFPLITAMPLAITLLLGRFVFHENIGYNGWLGSCLALVGVAVLSLG